MGLYATIVLVSPGVVEIESSAGQAGAARITRSMDRVAAGLEAATAACPVGLNWRFSPYREHHLVMTQE